MQPGRLDETWRPTQDYNVDSYACEKDARQSGYFGGGIVGQINFNEFEGRCMRARGWTLAHASASNPVPGNTSPSNPVPGVVSGDTQVTCQLSDSEPMQMSFSVCLSRGGSATY
jgi:hypothetical protein